MTVDVDAARAQLPALLDVVERGEPVTIARAGLPVADEDPEVLGAFGLDFVTADRQIVVAGLPAVHDARH